MSEHGMLPLGVVVKNPYLGHFHIAGPEVMRKACQQITAADEILEVLEEHEIRYGDLEEVLQLVREKAEQKMMNAIIRKEGPF